METFKAGKGPAGGSSGREHRAVTTPNDAHGSHDFMIIIVFVVSVIYISWSSFGSKDENETAPRRRKGKPREPYTTAQEVESAIRQQGLESCSLMVAVDFTKSNEWMGKRTYGNRCLHDTSQPESPNPYQRVISIIGKTLAHFDDDGIIPAYGFGDTVQMSGPTNFAPAIREAVKRVKKEDNAFHVLLIIADGQVDREEDTVKAIVEASRHPIAIICIGVGDGPWDLMHKFDDDLPARRFDNFQFVELNGIEDECAESGLPLEPQFALAALMELPAQFRFLKQNAML
ncbi:Copine-domain-containing protein [Baffinella frigidus]|nr:Copine-domain-containing protein [Cryptophyta sp. CCMP2293]